MYRLICQKPAHFLSAQMALVSTFFKCLKYLGCITLNVGQKRSGSNGHANGSVNKKQKVLEESDIKAMKAFAQAKKIESM